SGQVDNATANSSRRWQFRWECIECDFSSVFGGGHFFRNPSAGAFRRRDHVEDERRIQIGNREFSLGIGDRLLATISVARGTKYRDAFARGGCVHENGGTGKRFAG